MITFYSAAIGILMLCLALSLKTVLLGKKKADRMIITQLFGTAGVAIVVLLSLVLDQPALLNVALVLALFSAMTLIAFFRAARRL